jgi:hypothetical protein
MMAGPGNVADALGRPHHAAATASRAAPFAVARRSLSPLSASIINPTWDNWENTSNNNNHRPKAADVYIDVEVVSCDEEEQSVEILTTSFDSGESVDVKATQNAVDASFPSFIDVQVIQNAINASLVEHDLETTTTAVDAVQDDLETTEDLFVVSHKSSIDNVTCDQTYAHTV